MITALDLLPSARYISAEAATRALPVFSTSASFTIPSDSTRSSSVETCGVGNGLAEKAMGAHAARIEVFANYARCSQPCSRRHTPPFADQEGTTNLIRRDWVSGMRSIL